MASPLARKVIEYFYEERAPADRTFTVARGDDLDGADDKEEDGES